jgi:hypothetical protein
MTSDQFLLELYKEEQAQSRHAETQRLEVTKFILVAVGVLVGVMATLRFSLYCVPIGIAVMLLGHLGRSVVKIYVSRFDDHRKRARAFRSAIDNMISPARTAQPILDQHPVDKSERVRDFWLNVNSGVFWLGLVLLVLNVSAVGARARLAVGWRRAALVELALPSGSR